MIKYSIITPTIKKNYYLEKLYLNIKKFDTRIDIEFIVISNQKVEFAFEFKKIIYKNIVSEIDHPGRKRDLAFKYSRGKYLIFIDDDAFFDTNYFDELDSLLEFKEYEVLCGPNITPKDDTFLGKLSGSTYLNPFLGVSYRYTISKKEIIKRLDDFPSVNLVVSSKLFSKVNGFDNDFWPGDDTFLCNKIVENHSDIFFFNNLIVYHYRRSTFIKHFRQVYRYGLTRGYFFRLNLKNSKKITYILPSIFLVFNLFLLLNFKFYFIFIIIIYLIFLLSSVFSHINILIALLSPLLIILNFYNYGFAFIKGYLTKKLISKLGR